MKLQIKLKLIWSFLNLKRLAVTGTQTCRYLYLMGLNKLFYSAAIVMLYVVILASEIEYP